MINTHEINNDNIVAKIADKKIDDYYNGSKDNFSLEGEIVVTITLSEYRNLIKEVATKEYDIKRANQDKYERDCRNKALESENAELRQKLFAYINAYGKIEEDETNA